LEAGVEREEEQGKRALLRVLQEREFERYA
jgi:hypothetical protein